VTVCERSVQARWVSDDVLALAGAGRATGSVTARFGSTLYAELGDFVVAVVPPGAPRMPNGVSAGAALGGDDGPDVGDPVVLTKSSLQAGPVAIGWDSLRPPRWDARVVPWSREQGRGLRERARAILAAEPEAATPELATEWLARLGGFAARDPGARAGLESLVGAVRSGDPADARRAGRELTGRGPGLTPVGDDVLAAAALTVASAGTSKPAPSARRRAWLAALAPPDLRERTTSVSATLLELAVRGHGIGPACELLRPGPVHERRLRGELASLRRLGHTTGAAYAATIGAVALQLAWDENGMNDKETR
jgi:hypothetical protein